MLRNSVIMLFLALGISSDAMSADVDGGAPQTTVLHAEGSVTRGIGIDWHGAADTDLDQIRAAGFSFVRIDFRWDRIETAPGAYNWQDTDHRVAAIAARGMRPILILNYFNPLYMPGAPNARIHWDVPQDPPAFIAFNAWAAVAAQRYAHFAPVWELGNEPDSAAQWPARPSSGPYLALAESSCAAIRAVDSSATIWGPALSSQHHVSAVASPFLKDVLASSLPSCLSAISLHPYAFWSEIDREPEYWDAVRKLPARSTKPFVSSESGISNYGTGITAATQASYLPRMFIYDHMAHVPVTIWYDWRDDGRDPMNPEHHYGLLDINGNPKPSYKALVTLVHQTAGLDRQCLVRDGGRALLYDWRHDRPDELLLVAWSTAQGLRRLSADPTGSINVPLPTLNGAPAAVDFSGKPTSITQIGSDSWQVGGGGQPYYVRYRGTLPSVCS